MEIIHRVSMQGDEQGKKTLNSLGIGEEDRLKIPQLPGQRLVIFEIAESDPRWKALEKLIAAGRAADFVTTHFVAEELARAPLLRMLPSWHHQYPQPEDAFGYRQASYDLTEYCLTCGIGKKQISPIRFRHEPKWGRRHILQVNWIFDEFFALPEVYAAIFKPLGIGAWPVLHHTFGRELQTIVQLQIDVVADPALLMGSHPCTTCPDCGRAKYAPLTRGFFPPLKPPPDRPMVKTREYFGSGASAHRAVIISGDLYRQMRSKRVRGVEFVPLAE